MLPTYRMRPQSIRTAGYLNGKPSVSVVIFRQPGANIIQTNASHPRSNFPFWQAVMPQGNRHHNRYGSDDNHQGIAA